MIKRVLYYSGYRMKVFEWLGKELLGSAGFEPDEAGFAAFNDYLKKTARIPTLLLVDLIEEGFRQESIPHTRGKDREAIITRLLDRHYRGEAHVHVENIGRSKEGRKDDELLLSALTNSEILTPWLTPLVEHEVPLAGIWSLPLLTGKLLGSITQNEKNVIIQSRHLRSAQRDSYFKDGKLFLSRQAKLDRDRRDRRDRRDQRNNYEGQDRRDNERRDLPARPLLPGQDDAQTDGQDRRQGGDRRVHQDRRIDPSQHDENSPANIVLGLTKNINDIHIFLTNQRIMGFTDPLYVYCIMPNHLIEETRQHIKDTNTIHYRFAGIDELFAAYKLKHCEQQEADALFAYLCASAPIYKDHYGNAKQKRFYREYLIDYGLMLTTALGALMLSVGASLLWLNTIELEQEKQRVNERLTVLEQRYQTQFSPIQHQLDDVTRIQMAVDLAGHLKRQQEVSPDQVFEALSSVFDQSVFSDITLDFLRWKKYPQEDLDSLLKTQQQTVSEAVDDATEAYEEEPESPGYMDLKPLLMLEGSLKRGERSYRETIEVMDAFAQALSTLPQVTKVVVLKIPVEARPALSFADNVGVADEVTRNKKEYNQYQILLGLDTGGESHE